MDKYETKFDGLTDDEIDLLEALLVDPLTGIGQMVGGAMNLLQRANRLFRFGLVKIPSIDEIVFLSEIDVDLRDCLQNQLQITDAGRACAVAIATIRARGIS